MVGLYLVVPRQHRVTVSVVNRSVSFGDGTQPDGSLGQNFISAPYDFVDKSLSGCRGILCIFLMN